jgi:regulator of sirC expression with transglutaminase-like and TPR domain
MAGTLTSSRVDALRQRLLELADGPADLAEAALVIAAEHQDPVDIPANLARLDEWADRAAAAVGPTADPAAQAQALIALIHRELRFAGNSENYYDPRNSYFDRVLERRTGIPITMALVYIAVGRRAGIPVAGVGFPGHFLIRIGTEPAAIVDPFTGTVLTRTQCQERLTTALGPEAVLRPEHLAEAAPRDILVRMLRNLKHIYLGRATREETPASEAAEADRHALACCDRMLLLRPDDPNELRDRGFVHGRMGHAVEACADLERALELAPSAEGADAVRRGLPALRMLAGPLN